VKRLLADLSMILLCSMAFAISFTYTDQAHPFDSEVRLGSIDFSPTLTDEEREFYEQCEVGIMTLSKGDPLYSWFGHTALVFTQPDGYSMSFDWGVFSFNSERFYINFAMGQLWYMCSCSTTQAHIAGAIAENRYADLLVLKLEPEKKKAVLEFLSDNMKAENRTYLYQHYTDNCATRVRDIIDFATDGAFGAWARSIDAGTTYRLEASKALGTSPAALWALNTLQGGSIDKPISLWDKMFLPSSLHDALLAYPGLVERVEIVNDNSATEYRTPVLSEPADGLLEALAASLGLCLALSLVHRVGDKRKLYCLIVAVLDLSLGLIGSLMVFMASLTTHTFSYFNENLLLLNPILLFYSIAEFRYLFSRHRRVRNHYLVPIICTAILVACKLALPSVFLQDNWAQVISLGIYFATRALLPIRRKALKEMDLA